jgi:hypothetical protein
MIALNIDQLQAAGAGMKRIVNGVTYNTDTSTLLARAECATDHEREVDCLYQTRGGAYFVHEETTQQIWNEKQRGHEERVENKFVPMSPEDSNKWLLEGDIEVFHNPFGDPPEAESEAEASPGATLYIRMPSALKKRVDEAAKAANVSGNVWAMRCIERCLDAGESQYFALR